MSSSWRQRRAKNILEKNNSSRLLHGPLIQVDVADRVYPALEGTASLSVIDKNKQPPEKIKQRSDLIRKVCD